MEADTNAAAGYNSLRSFNNSSLSLFETLFAKDIDSVKNHRLENLGRIFSLCNLFFFFIFFILYVYAKLHLYLYRWDITPSVILMY
jgi:hypothetical protein